MFSRNFPIVEQLNQIDIQIQIERKHPTANNSVVGFKLVDRDSTSIVSVTLPSISYSRLAPYNGWDIFSQESTNILSDLKRLIGYRAISRIGVRYVNRLDIPLPEDNVLVRLEHYIRVYPEYPEHSFPPLDAFTMQANFSLHEIKCLAMVTVASVPSPLPRHMGIILDTDIGRQADVPQSDKDIRELLNVIRGEKNRVFEACITDAARELFDR
jgi:uncharacterized protein (TIGR04255 family)